MSHSFKAAAALAAAALALTACSVQQDECFRASNPAECASWRDAGGDVQDYLVGGMAGFMLGRATSGGQQQTVIIANPSYHGPARHLRSPILPRDVQIQRMQAKIDRQRIELRRQQAANARKNAQISAMRSSGASRPSGSSYRSTSSSTSFRRK